MMPTDDGWSFRSLELQIQCQAKHLKLFAFAAGCHPRTFHLNILDEIANADAGRDARATAEHILTILRELRRQRAGFIAAGKAKADTAVITEAMGFHTGGANLNARAAKGCVISHGILINLALF